MPFSRSYLQCRQLLGIVFLVLLVCGLMLFITSRHYDTPSTLPVREIRFLHHKQLLSTTNLLESEWILTLRNILSSRHSIVTDKFLIVVSCTKTYYNVLVNWMAALRKNTKLDVADVLIIVTDEELYLSLQTRKLSSLYVRKESVIREPEKYTSFYQILMIRCTVVRLLNHLGYDIAMVDLDALLLQDPRILFQQHPDAQIVASRGTYPPELSKQWGLTLCMGMVFFRSGPATELFWNKASSVYNDTIDDQVKINHALSSLKVRWFTESSCSHVSECTVYGRAWGGLNVVLLPEQIVCRHCTYNSPHTDMVVWHQLVEKVGKSKEKVAKSRKMWYLKPGWRRISSGSSLVGGEWVQQITRIKS